MLLRIPRLEPRINIFLFANSMEETANELHEKMGMYKLASREVRSSLSLRRIFKTILNLGNYLNYGYKDAHLSSGNCVKGFELESLLKLSEFRSSQHSDLSALHCVVVHILQQLQNERNGKSPKMNEEEREAPSLWIETLKNELVSVVQIGRGNIMQVSDIQAGIDAFLKSVELVRTEANNHPEDYAKSDDFLVQLLPYCELQGEALRQDLDELFEQASTLLDFFATSKTPFQKFFETLWKFAESLETAWKDVLNNPKKFGKFVSADVYTISDNLSSKSTEKQSSSKSTEKSPEGPREGVSGERVRRQVSDVPTKETQTQQSFRGRRRQPTQNPENEQ